MINILTMSGFCSSVMLFNVLIIVKRSLGLIQLIGPILAIIALIISFTRLTLNPDQEEVYKKKIKNSIMATMVLFLIPAAINLIMSLPVIEDNTTMGVCWSNIDRNNHDKQDLD